MHYTYLPIVDATWTDLLVVILFSDTAHQDLPVFCLAEPSVPWQILLDTCEKKGDFAAHTLSTGKRVLLVQWGDRNLLDHSTLKQCLAPSLSLLTKQEAHTIRICLPEFDNALFLRLFLQIDAACYPLTTLKSKPKDAPSIETIQFSGGHTTEANLNRAVILGDAIRLTKTLANLPANHCTPRILAEKAVEVARNTPGLTADIIDEQGIADLGMGALLAVAKGSAEPPRLIEIHYKGNTEGAPIVLVGKGITFDSGGLSLKPPNMMDEMKYDMSGAASVLGALQACAALKLPIHVIGLMPCAENLPGPTATKPGDVITSMSGQTVEIINTDAEGRLILADALTYAERFKPEYVVDIATLTGAVIIALGHINTGLMTTDEGFAEALLAAGARSGDTCWRLPLQADYQDALDSDMADMINAKFDRAAGTVTAACFLSRFTKAYRWAHLDIAGTAWVSGKNPHATGRPVSLLVEWIEHVAHTR